MKPAKKNMLDDFGFMKNHDSQKVDVKDIRKTIRKKIAKKRS